MALSPFGVQPGIAQGRIKPSGWVAPDGEYVLGLGHDTPGYFAILNAGDAVVWSQSNVGTAAPFVIRPRVRIRPPVAELPPGVEWVLFFYYAGGELLRLPVNHARDLKDVLLNTGQIATLDMLEIYLVLLGSGTWLEVELPAVYLDAFNYETPAAPMLLANRLPEPLEVGVPANTEIKFDIVMPSIIDGLDTSRTIVTINGAEAFNAGLFLPPFDGPNVGIDYNIDNSTGVRFTFDPTVPFDSLSTVTVHVLAYDNNDPLHVLDETYTFTIEDLTAPTVVAAMAVDTKRVRVSFSETIKASDTTAENDGLHPENYVILAKSAPAVDVLVTSVEAFSASAFDLITNIELSPGATYELTVSFVEDLAGNVIGVPYKAVFFAFTPPKPAGRRFDLWKMLPQVARDRDETGDLRRFVSCLQEITDLLLYDIDRFALIFDPDVAPEWALDLMLSGLGNPFPFALSVIDKRRLLRVLVRMYRMKGTAIGIIDVIRFFLGIDVIIITYTGEGLVLGESELGVDWILGPSDAWALYAFEIVATQTLTDEQRERIRFIANYMKPAHTHLARIVEPEAPEVIDHLELGLSELGTEWLLH